MKDIDLAWAAGIIDGEGCIYIQRIAPNQKAKKITPAYRVGLRVVMGHEGAIRKLHSLFNQGSVHKLSQRGYNDAWALMAQSRKAGIIIEAVRPYLVVKAAEADVALEFLTIPLWQPGGNGGCFSVTPPEIVARKHELFERIRDLKPSSRFRKEG